MKKLFLFLFLVGFASISKADDVRNRIRVYYEIPQSFLTAAQAGVISSVTIQAAGGGLKNCLTDWSFMSTTVSNMIIMDGPLASGTTLWGLISAPASTPVNIAKDSETALCGGPNTRMILYISSGTVSINYRGHVRSSP